MQRSKNECGASCRDMLVMAFVLLSMIACSGDEAARDRPERGDVEATSARPLPLSSSGGCVIDDDCREGTFCFQNTCAHVCVEDADCEGDSSCTPRGLCDGQPVVETIPRLEFTAYPDTVQIIEDDQEEVSFEFKLNGPLPPSGLAYRVWRSDGLSDEFQIHSVRGDRVFTITLPVGAASSRSDERTDVRVKLFTALGDVDLYLTPAPALKGIWKGDAEITTFGGQMFSVDVHLLDDDPDNLRVGLPLDRASLFSPYAVSGDETSILVVEATYNASLGVYQAVFQNSYAFPTGVFEGLPTGQVERVMRFDFEADALRRGTLQGRFADQWTGLFDVQRVSGEGDTGVLLLTGGISYVRDGDLASAESYHDVGGEEATPDVIGHGAIYHCENSDFDVAHLGEGFEGACAGITSSEDFEASDANTRAMCALAVGETIQLQETTADQLNAYFSESGQADGPGFEQFLQSCADDSSGPCMTTPGARCAFELAAHALRDVSEEGQRDALMELFVESSREAFLARQLGAFFTDMDLRRQWLSQSAAPAVFLANVEQANIALLDEWEVRVLDVHADLFSAFFTPNALATMGRSTNNATLNALRREHLQEAATLWRSYAGALQLAARRWNEVLKDPAGRAERVAMLRARALDLYLVMGLITEFNRAAGAGAQAALMAGDFNSLAQAIKELDKSFDERLFARDAEVVTARSLDPLSDNASLLSERRSAAIAAVSDAREGIDSILEEASMEALQEQELRNRLQDARREAANAVARICGLPVGCTEEDLLTDSDCLNVSPGSCGLLDAAVPDTDISFDPQRVAASQAGSAILDVLEALHNLRIQNDELEGHFNILDLEYQELMAFKDDVEHWNEMRLAGVQRLAENLEQRQRFRDDRIETLLQNIQERARLRGDTIDLMRERFAEWDQIRVDGATTSYETNLGIIGLRRSAGAIQVSMQEGVDALLAYSEGFPKVTGAANDPSFVQRAKAYLLAGQMRAVGDHAALHLNFNADIYSARRERDSALAEARMAAMQEQAQVVDAIGNADLDAVIEAMELSNATTDAEIARLEDILELMRAQLEAELAYQRDMAEFRARRTQHLQNQVETSGLVLRLERSVFNVSQRTKEYEALVQEARLEAVRLVEIGQQLTNLENLVGGMGAVFAQSYLLDRAEGHLYQARKALMEWLIVLEYYAVRPFFAERIQIMLARNAYQLEAIAERLQELEQSCGGSERSSSSAVLSLRRDILGLTRSIESAASGEAVEPAERFRRWLQQSHIPVDRRVRWSTSSSLSQVLERTDGVLAATFSLGLDHFANLTLACNAKITSISAQLVGDVGEVRPTISLLYDGTSQLRSCQPGVDDYVEAFGQGMSSYGSITQLRAAGRAMSPLAGINAFPDTEREANRTLAGLPVASTYTVLIDTTLGDNASVDWSQLEDVLFEVNYSYQDLFPQACD